MNRTTQDGLVERLRHDPWPADDGARKEAADIIGELRDALEACRDLLARYRKETPTGHSPHMICHVADKALVKADTALAKVRP